ncbi:NAD(P)-dependent oxidoreductase [Kocuria sp. SM24M-10]|uniref:NAD(P)-dependent oxidoreductase n=1 Tax=Kocuria sp. SM24M-10 TaxID=1660349 RepID=UPI0006994CCC|nr:NAD(P)H-binding protein [Kocuria sp. SM24M-10]
MRIAVAGATGNTGSHVVSQALGRGYEVRALARRPEAITARDERLTVVPGNVLEPATLGPLVEGVDAVISAVGIGTQRTPTKVYSQGTKNLLEAMEQAGIQPIITISSGTLAQGTQASWGQRLILFPLLHRLYGASYTDMRCMEEILAGSSADWTVIRPPGLVDKPAAGTYRALRLSGGE